MGNYQTVINTAVNSVIIVITRGHINHYIAWLCINWAHVYVNLMTLGFFLKVFPCQKVFARLKDKDRGECIRKHQRENILGWIPHQMVLCTLLFHYHSLLSLTRVIHSPASAVWLNKGILSLDYVSIACFVLIFVVTRNGIFHVIREGILRVGIVFLSLGRWKKWNS